MAEDVGDDAEQTLCINCCIDLHRASDLFIRCADCSKKNKNVFVCIKCFRLGAECGPHKRGHIYQINDPHGPPLFKTTKNDSQGRWGWREDRKLLAAAHTLKLGNWEEIAQRLGTGKSAEQVRVHFDRFFVRGYFGQYAASNLHWPYVDDMTSADPNEPERAPLFSGKRRFGAGPCRFQYITDFIKNFNGDVDFDDKNWYEPFEKAIAFAKTEHDSSASKVNPSEFHTEAKTPRFLMGNRLLKTPPLSPISLKSSMFERDAVSNGGQENVSSSESDDVPLSSKPLRRSGRSRTRIACAGIQSSDDEDDHVVAKPMVSRKYRVSILTKKAPVVMDANKSCRLSEIISQSKKEKLLETYPEPYYLHRSLPVRPDDDVSKVNKEDLQLLAYMPDRDDFEWEYNNDAERIISRLMLQMPASDDEDAMFENHVKLAKVQKYNRILKQRKMQKALIREFDLVSQFFEKVKKTDEWHSSLDYNQKYHAIIRKNPSLRPLINRIHQVVSRNELSQFLHVLASRIAMKERMDKLQQMQSDGVKVLRGVQRIEPDQSPPAKRKRKSIKCNATNRKANLRWNRFKRWSMLQNGTNDDQTMDESTSREN